VAEGLRRIVLDPNVLISAAITPAGSNARIVRLIDAGAIVPIVSPKRLTELNRVLRRPRFRRYLDVEAVSAFISELERLAEWADDPDDPPSVSPDPGDDYPDCSEP
jgi:putative PIN family toxin of toxin-antitoxin system